MRELREFRVRHEEFRREGVHVAGVTRESHAESREWGVRMALPFPLLADDGTVMRALGVVRPVPLGPWTLEYFRRSTLLVDSAGIIAAAWGAVRIRGHAEEVLRVAVAARSVEIAAPPATGRDAEP